MAASRKDVFDKIEFRIIKVAILVIALIVVLELILVKFIGALKMIMTELKSLF